MEEVDSARQSLITWIDLFCQGGLKALTKPMKSEREQRLGVEEKEELKKIILAKKPTDYGIDRQIWTGKIIIEEINQKWNIQQKIVGSTTSPIKNFRTYFCFNPYVYFLSGKGVSFYAVGGFITPVAIANIRRIGSSIKSLDI